MSQKHTTTDENKQYASDTYGIAMAIMKTDIDYIKKAVDQMGDDIREIKGLYLPIAQAATKEEVKRIQDKVEQLYKIGWFVFTAVGGVLIYAILQLIVIK
jgi:hypothetical protein